VPILIPNFFPSRRLSFLLPFGFLAHFFVSYCSCIRPNMRMTETAALEDNINFFTFGFHPYLLAPLFIHFMTPPRRFPLLPFPVGFISFYDRSTPIFWSFPFFFTETLTDSFLFLGSPNLGLYALHLSQSRYFFSSGLDPPNSPHGFLPPSRPSLKSSPFLAWPHAHVVFSLQSPLVTNYCLHSLFCSFCLLFPGSLTSRFGLYSSASLSQPLYRPTIPPPFEAL